MAAQIEDLIAEADTLVLPLLQPLSPLPAGEDVRGSRRHQDLEEAAREDEELALKSGVEEKSGVAGKKADWKAVREISTALLAERSKDLTLGIWYTEAAFRRDELPGLIAGFRLLKGLIDRFWDQGLFPEPDAKGDPRQRVSELRYMDEDFPVKLASLKVSASYTYSRYLEAREVGAEKDTFMEGTTDFADQTKKQRRAAALAAGRISVEMFDEAVKSTPLDFYRRLDLHVRATQKALAELTAAVDARMPRPGYFPANAINARLREIGGLVALILAQKAPPAALAPEPPPAAPPPGREDSAPTPAIAETPKTTPAAAPEPSTPGTTAAPVSAADAWANAEQLALAGDLPRALAEMARLSAVDCPRTRFLRRLALAEICIRNGRREAAIAALRQLSEDAEKHSLPDWESSDLMARIWGNLYRMLRTDENTLYEGNQFYDRLFKLDPWQALRWRVD